MNRQASELRKRALFVYFPAEGHEDLWQWASQAGDPRPIFEIGPARFVVIKALDDPWIKGRRLLYARRVENVGGPTGPDLTEGDGVPVEWM